MCQISYYRLGQELSSFKLSSTSTDSAKYLGIPYLRLIFILWLSLSFSTRDTAATYREHFVHNDKICPNPLHARAEFPKDTLIVSLPKKLPLFGPVNDFPCNFASTSEGGLKKVIVRAIHPNRYLWDYSQANSCDYFIKFKRSDTEKTDIENKKDVICRVLKQDDNSFHQGSFFHPMMWNSPNHKMTLSFSTYDWDHALENNSTAVLKPVYLQMVFLVYGDNNQHCSLRVQQYLIDPMRSINKSCSWDFQHCGQYECSDAKQILESIGFRTYEIDELEYARKRHKEITNSVLDPAQEETGFHAKNKYNNNNNNKSGGNSPNNNNHQENSVFHRLDVTTEETISTSQEYDIYKTTTGTVTYYNNSNSVHNSFHSYAVSSILVVPLIVIIVAVLAIRCYISRTRNGYRTYESRESLIVPLNPHPVIMNTHVAEDGNVILGDVYPAAIHHHNRFWSRDYNNSMDYIQPVDLRSIHRMSAATSKITISAPPSYETLGPPRYSDAVII